MLNLELQIMSNRLTRLTISLSLYIFYSFNLFASDNGKIEGSVTAAATNGIIPYATVELLRSSDSTLLKGTFTDNDGNYLFENVTYGKYLLRISFLGYKKAIIPEFELTLHKPAIKIETTKMIAESILLNEVVVTGYKLTGVLKDNKTVYAINTQSAEMAHTGIELLRLLPDVTVDYLSENVKMAGSNNIIFQVNGRKVDRNYLTQLNPELVDNIEVINNPGAKFDSDIDAVININLKKEMQYGFSGRGRIQIPTSSTLLSKNNGNIDLYFKKVRLYVGGSYNLNSYKTENINKRTAFSPDSSLLFQQGTGTIKGRKTGITYGVDWFVNENNILNFYSSIQPRTPDKNEIVTDNKFISEQLNSHNLSNNTNINKSYFYDYSLFFQHKFARKFHEISFESYLSNNGIAKTGNYYQQNYASDNQLSDQILNIVNQVTDNSSKQFIMKVDYTYPISEKLKFSTGYSGNFLKSYYSYSNLTTDFSDMMAYQENRHAVYTNLSWANEKLSIQTGARYEYSEIQITYGNFTTTSYNSLLPSVVVQYKTGKRNTFRINYRESFLRPIVSQLSPVNYQEDQYLQTIGNMDLKPAYTHKFELTHNIQIGDQSYLSYRPYISFIKNDIRQINIMTNDSVLLQKYDNVGNDFEYGITMSGSATVAKRWTISPSFTWYKRQLSTLPVYGILAANRTSWRLNISSQFVLPKEWVLFVDFNYNAPILNYQSITQSYYDFVVGFNKLFFKKINVSMFTLNPWSTLYVYENHTVRTNTMVQDTKEGLKYDYLFLIRLGYKFNSGKIGKKLDREPETHEEMKKGKEIF
jgi:hypothetical protein